MNTKVVGVYIGILVILLILVFFFLPTKSTIFHSTTTIPQTTAVQPSTAQSTLTTVAVYNGSSCLTSNATVPIENGAFQSGTYAGWNLSGPGFGVAPTNLQDANKNGDYYGTPWAGYNGMYFASNFRGGTSVAVGNITSAPFSVTGKYLNFKLISAQSNQLYVQILVNGTPAITTYFNTYSAPGNVNASSTFVNASVTMIPLICKEVQIKVVGGTVGTLSNQFNYIALTDFYLSNKPESTPDILVNQSFT